LSQIHCLLRVKEATLSYVIIENEEDNGLF
jgi:hypothetical protein